jgi:hypothetical protein
VFEKVRATDDKRMTRDFLVVTGDDRMMSAVAKTSAFERPTWRLAETDSLWRLLRGRWPYVMFDRDHRLFARTVYNGGFSPPTPVDPATWIHYHQHWITNDGFPLAKRRRAAVALLNAFIEMRNEKAGQRDGRIQFRTTRRSACNR